MSARASESAVTLEGRWLFLARAAWAAVAVTTLAIIVFGVPSSLEYYRSLCTAGAEICAERAVRQPTPEGVEALRDVGVSLNLYALLNVALDKVFQLTWFAVGVFIFWRRSDDRMALLVSAFLVSFGSVAVDPTAANALVASQPAWWLPVRGVEVAGIVGAALFFLLFPSGRFVPRWTRWLAVVSVANDTSLLFPGLYSRSPVLEAVSYWVFLGTVGVFIWAQIYRYRKVSSPTQRQQTKWVVFGAALGVAGTFPTQLPVDLALVGGDTPLTLLLLKTGFSLSFLLLPLSIGVAVLRSRLFDVDVLINRTLVYGSLTVSLAVVYFGGVVGSQRLLSPLVGGSNQLIVVASTLAIAALFNPLRRRIQSFIDRRFYRKKFDAAETLAAFSEKLKERTDLDALNSDLVGMVRETMQPEHVTLWLRSPAEAARGPESEG